MSVAAEKETAMSVVNMAKDIKKVHPEDVVMYKVGNFVQSFGKDAYILSYVLTNNQPLFWLIYNKFIINCSIY